MKASSNRPGRNNRHPLLAIAAVLLVPALLAGCARPGDTDISKMLGEVYQCKWLELEEFRKTDSLPGLWTYVAQYTFQIKIKDGEEGARNFNKGLFAAMPGNEKDLKKALQSPQVQEYLKTDCSESAQSMLSQLAGDVLNQLEDKKNEVRLPVIAPISGWAEFSTGRKGWDMDVRRDKISGAIVYAEPMKWEQLSPKAAAIKQAGK